MSDMDWNGDQIIQAVTDASKSGVRLAAEHLRQVAVQRTPLETGALRNSAKVTADGTKAAVSYNTKYAAKQHEELGYAHKDGQAKYLESATISEKQAMAEIIAQQIRGAL